ncbi:hypothetical protein [Streptomyces sp. NPDC048248]|uniref:lipase/acyltransferase domain-containing protein n=1 Tax=Streptomyces sp. NPDC048248 TaxID=3365523 RepID=UPI0037109F0E
MLADAAREHLEQWRRHPAHTAARKHRVDECEGRLVFIAHSMGGLITQAALDLGPDRDLQADTRGVMPLGTPFHGAVMAASILNTGQGAPLPLPHGKLKTLASTMPGVHDLLPRFPCLDEGLTVRRLDPTDVVALGGDKDLAVQPQAFYDKLRGQALPRHRAVVGVSQRTLQSMSLQDGVVVGFEHTFREHNDGELMRDAEGAPRRFPVAGDGTVHKESAARTRTVIPYSLQHGALATDDAAMEAVTAFLEGDEHLGPDQATSGLGLTVPDFVTPNTNWEIQVTGTDAPAGIVCTVESTDHHYSRPARLYADDDDALTARVQVPDIGLYPVTVQADVSTPLTQLVLAGTDHDAD